MSNDTMTDAERKEFLASIGLNPDAPNLTPVQDEPAKAAEPRMPKSKPSKPASEIPEQNRRTIHPTNIVFDETDIEGFDLSTWDGKKAATDHLFGLYKSPRRDPERNPLLWRLVGEFVGKVARARKTGTSVVKERIKATEEQRDMAAFLAEQGITLEELAAFIKAKDSK